MTRVLLLGGDGMLGTMLARVLGAREGLELIVIGRAQSGDATRFDARRDPLVELLDAHQPDWVVNAIGVIASRIDESDPASVAAAIEVNGAFPQRLAAAAPRETRVIHFTTDGVFSGARAPYDESDPHDAEGVYARSKSLGEAGAPNVVNLRCSIVGPQATPPARSLLAWALSQPPGAAIEGYANRRWNGLTTLHLARICAGLIAGRRGGDLPGTLHLVPGDSVSKAELVQLILAAFGRDDVSVEPVAAAPALDLRLASRHPDVLSRLWAEAGYPEAPTIATMIAELAQATA